jgi:hypothetical protein
VHDRLVGAGTTGAALAEHLFCVDAAVAMRSTVEHGPWSECLVQLVVGLPLYIALAYLAVRLAEWASARFPSTPTHR